jgi:hypothetical protein
MADSLIISFYCPEDILLLKYFLHYNNGLSDQDFASNIDLMSHGDLFSSRSWRDEKRSPWDISAVKFLRKIQTGHR